MPEERSFSFGPFRLVPQQHMLLRDEHPVRVGNRALEILTALVEHPGEVVGKDTLMARVWPDTFVEGSNLKVNVAALRKVLGERAGAQPYIVAVNGRGYQFVAPVERVQGASRPLAASGNLPALPHMVGRFEAEAAVAGWLERDRLVTLTGPGGVGKTTLAITVAHALLPRQRNGAWMLDLGTVQDARYLANDLAAAIGLTLHTTDPPVALANALADWQVLLVLDCCETVLGEAARVAEHLIAAAPGLRILATSREPLGLRQERVYRLPPLPVPPADHALTAAQALTFPAAKLFVERASARIADLAVRDEDAAILAELCRRLDGIPLAIELAATRMEAFGLRGLLAHLEDWFSLLSHGRGTAVSRHQSLAATLDWSHDLLAKDEHTVFRRLAVFSGPFAMRSAVAVAALDALPAARVAESVAELVAKSLVAANPHGTETIYRLLDTTRAYALRRLAESGELDRVRRRHAEHVRELCHLTVLDGPAGPDAAWHAELKRTADNVREALAWAFCDAGDPHLGHALTVAAIPLWEMLALSSECIASIEHALAIPASAGSCALQAEMVLRVALGTAILQTAGPLPEVAALWQRGIAIADELGNTEYRLRALWGLCDFHVWTGDHRRALALIEEIRAIATAAGDGATQLAVNRQATVVLRYLGELTEARRAAETLLARYEAPGRHVPRFHSDPIITARNSLANILWLQGEAEAAARTAEQALEDARASGHAFALTNALAHTSIPIALHRGEFELGARLLDELERHCTSHGMRIWRSIAHCLEGILLLQRGEPTGLARLGSALEAFGETGFRMRYPAYLASWASGLAVHGDLPGAQRTLESALDWSERSGEYWCRPELLRLKGELVLREKHAGGSSQAEALFCAALDLARRQGARAWGVRAANSLARLWQDPATPALDGAPVALA